MLLQTFLDLPTAEIARIVRANGVSSCAFPINGTRRWYMLERPPVEAENPAAAYLEAIIPQHVSLYRHFFSHGISTLLTPIFGPDLLERGSAYTEMAVRGIEYLYTHPAFLEFYDRFQVRIGFYGDYRKFFAGTNFAYLIDVFENLKSRTARNDNHRLFFGVCANDATQTIAELSIQYYQQHEHIPDKRTIVTLYYGEYVEPISFFIGFDKFTMFDVPLVTKGDEDLYFTVSPSLYLTEHQLRLILYDHLYTRRLQETDYSDMSEDDIALMRAFYRKNRENTLGVGGRQPRGEFWYPLPLVDLLPEFDHSQEE